MGRKKGTFSLSANLEVKAAAPLDPRELVDTLEDLTANDTFPYPFEGLEVYVKSEQKKYMLIGSDPTVESNWVQAGGEGGAKIFKGTVEEWNALTLEEKIAYDYTVFTDDNAGGGATAAESGFIVNLTQDENSGNLVPDKTKEELDQAIADGQEILAKVVGSEYLRFPLTDHQDSVFSFETIIGYGQDAMIGGFSIDYSEDPVQVTTYQKEHAFSGEFNHDKIIYSIKNNNEIEVYDAHTDLVTPEDLRDFETSEGYFVLNHNGIWYSYRGEFPQGFKFEDNQKTVYLVPKAGNNSEWEDIVEEEITFTGTQAAWDALSAKEKAKYDGKIVNITDDASGANLDYYSTSEVKTNKVWIDGKPIYRKVFYINNPVINWTKVSLNLNDIDWIVTREYTAKRTNNAVITEYYNHDSDNYEVHLLTENGTVFYYCQSSTALSVMSITIEYTKTTD